MKLQRFFMLGCMVAAIALIASCSAEDGKNGLDGADGADGANGAAGPAGVAGADGADGADGLACWDLNGNGMGDFEEDINGDEAFDALDCQGADGADGADGAGFTAERIIMDTTVFAVAENPVTLTVDQLTQEILDTNVILVYISDGSNNYYTIPGSIQVLDLYDFGVEIGVGEIIITDHNAFGWQPSIFQEVHIVLIPTNSTSNPPVVAKSQQDVLASLKAKGVDTSDYKEVVRYFGIK